MPYKAEPHFSVGLNQLSCLQIKGCPESNYPNFEN
jgi:hypothetical protein